jgi:uncharacterized protein
VTSDASGEPVDDGVDEDADEELDADDFDEDDEEDEFDDDEDDFDEDEFEDEDDDEDSEDDEGDDFEEDAEGYEPGDVNAVAGGDYEAGDVNPIEGGAPPAARHAPAEAPQASGGTSVAVLTYLAQSMADDPEAVVIREEERRGSTVLRLHVAPRDMGRVIGRRGRTAQAIRTLVAAAGARDGVQVAVDIVDD